MAGHFTREELGYALVGPYLSGMCTAFAVAVHRRTGWPLAVLRAGNGEYIHCGCVHPDGGYVDARGLADEHGFTESFGWYEAIVPCTEAQALVEHPQDERLIERAALHAELLLDLPGTSPHRTRAESFARALEALCREHGMWLRGPSAGTLGDFIAYEAYGDEGPFDVTLMPAGGTMLERTLRPGP